MIMTGKYRMDIAETVVRMCKAYFGLVVGISLRPRHDLEDSEAYCVDLGDSEYEIELSTEFLKNCSEQQLVEVVAHEMVHVKQHELDGLEMGLKAVMFRDKIYYDEEYWFSPWEIEARGYERAFWALYTEVWECV